jgi:hypothetical protein
MGAVTGIFRTQADAARAVETLHAAGFAEKTLTVLTPGSDPAGVPAATGEQPGLGRAIGGVAGGAAGAAVGMQVFAAATAGLIPGVGPVLAVGALAALVGGAGGAAAGQAIEDTLVEGLPKDELYFYEEFLRQGRSVVVVLAPDDDRAGHARRILEKAGAESVDAAREAWWIGLRDAEALAYFPDDPARFAKDEAAFRRGFEMALRLRGEPLTATPPDVADAAEREAHRRGFARGCEYYRRHGSGPPMTREAR